jgi:hypothetical protein
VTWDSTFKYLLNSLGLAWLRWLAVTSERGGQVLTRNSRCDLCGGLRDIATIYFPSISGFPRHNFSTIALHSSSYECYS